MRYVWWTVLLAGFAACGPSVRVKAYGRESAQPAASDPPAFPSPTSVPRRYRVFALIVAEATNRPEQELLDAARRKARSLGAQGIIVLRQEVDSRPMAMGEGPATRIEVRRLYAAAIRFTETEPDAPR